MCGAVCYVVCMRFDHIHTQKKCEAWAKKKNSINNKCDDSIELTHIPSEIQIKTWS